MNKRYIISEIIAICLIPFALVLIFLVAITHPKATTELMFESFKGLIKKLDKWKEE